MDTNIKLLLEGELVKTVKQAAKVRRLIDTQVKEIIARLETVGLDDRTEAVQKLADVYSKQTKAVEVLLRGLQGARDTGSSESVEDVLGIGEK